MTQGVYQDTYHDPLSFLATQKDREYNVRMQEQAYEELIRKIQSRSRGNIVESRGSRDALGEFIKQIERELHTPSITQREREFILRGFRLEIQGGETTKKYENRGGTSERSNKRTPPETKKPGTGGISISRDILSRFPVAYKNYTSMNQSLRDSIYRLSHIFGLNHAHVLGLIANESHFDEKAISPAGARGQTQLMPGTERGLKKWVTEGGLRNAGPEERFFAALRDNRDFMNIYNGSESQKNLALGIAYLGYLTQRYGEKALRIYNGGIRYPDNHENMDYTRRVTEFRRLFDQRVIPQEEKYITAIKK